MQAKDDFDSPDGMEPVAIRHQDDADANIDVTASARANLKFEMRVAQRVMGCLAAGLDDLSDDVVHRLQKARLAAVLSRRR